jgi:hypothetical protein
MKKGDIIYCKTNFSNFYPITNGKYYKVLFIDKDYGMFFSGLPSRPGCITIINDNCEMDYYPEQWFISLKQLRKQKLLKLKL